MAGRGGSHAEVRQDGQIPIHGVRVKGVAWHGQVVKTARAFPDFIEAHQLFPVGQPGEDGAPREALQVNDQVEMLGAQATDAAAHLRPVARAAPAFALEAHDASQVGIAFQQRRQPGLDPPEDLRLGPMEFQQPQDGQGLNHVAE